MTSDYFKKKTTMKPFNYCTVCGRSMDEQIPYYPYGFTEKPYCEKCASDVPTTKQSRLKAVRSPESRADIMRRRKNGEYVDQIRISYGVSYTTIYQIIQEERHGKG